MIPAQKCKITRKYNRVQLPRWKEGRQSEDKGHRDIECWVKTARKPSLPMETLVRDRLSQEGYRDFEELHASVYLTAWRASSVPSAQG